MQLSSKSCRNHRLKTHPHCCHGFCRETRFCSRRRRRRQRPNSKTCSAGKTRPPANQSQPSNASANHGSVSHQPNSRTVYKVPTDADRLYLFFRPSATVSRIGLMESCTCRHCRCRVLSSSSLSPKRPTSRCLDMCDRVALTLTSAPVGICCHFVVADIKLFLANPP